MELKSGTGKLEMHCVCLQLSSKLQTILTNYLECPNIQFSMEILNLKFISTTSNKYNSSEAWSCPWQIQFSRWLEHSVLIVMMHVSKIEKWEQNQGNLRKLRSFQKFGIAKSVILKPSYFCLILSHSSSASHFWKNP